MKIHVHFAGFIPVGASGSAPLSVDATITSPRFDLRSILTEMDARRTGSAPLGFFASYEQEGEGAQDEDLQARAWVMRHLPDVSLGTLMARRID